MDVDGEGNPVTRYTATASYTGTASSRYATGYTVSASYTGEVSKPNCAVATYREGACGSVRPEAACDDRRGGAGPGRWRCVRL